MKTKILLQVPVLIFVLSACQAATPPAAVTAPVDTEFTLVPGQSATIADTDITVTFNSVPGDDRCPIEVECAASGPVTVSLSVKQADEPATELTLQTFTDQGGRAPDREFEGIEDRVEVGDYRIRIIGVLPYPTDPSVKIKQSEYQATLLVSSK